VITPDSSVAVAAAAQWHAGHEAARQALGRNVATLGTHVAYETTAALSRMSEGHRISAGVVLEWLERRFPEPWVGLPPAAARRALRRAVEHGVRGGALYDALVGATAAHHGLTLLTADQRAAPVYRALGVAVEYVGET
jgi:predicted nucleic acid-binding protein